MVAKTPAPLVGKRGGLWSVLWPGLLARLAMAAFLVSVGLAWPADIRHVAPRSADSPAWAWVLSRGWDSNAYLGIAVDGYGSDFERAFPPGYPLAVRGVMSLGPDVATAGVLVSNTCAVLALVLFVAMARRLAAPGADLQPATTVFACTPGLLAFGTVAYSESAAILLGLAGWLARLRAGDGRGGAGRNPGWLLASSALLGGAVLVRHVAAATLVGVGLIEAERLHRAARGQRRRASGEACAALAAVAPVAAYLAWKFGQHDLGRVDAELWGMHFSLLGGPASLQEILDPESIAMLLLTLPLALLLLTGLVRLDGHLALVAGLQMALSLSFTGIAAQSVNRYVWSIWPLALGVLRLPDRAVAWSLAGVLALLSAMCGLGYVRGTLAL